MEHSLDREIRLVEESDPQSLYPWSLQEFDSDGTAVDLPQIPWAWSQDFTACGLSYRASLTLRSGAGASKDNDADLSALHSMEGVPAVDQHEVLTAVLYSGHFGGDTKVQGDTRYSMFGTGRTIKDFGLRIHKIADDTVREGCVVWGCPSYVAEIDFIDEVIDDALEVQLYLTPRRFNALAQGVRSRSISRLQISLHAVPGFYAEWEPGIKTHAIKVLTTRPDDQPVIMPEGCAITLPRLGPVGEFTLTVTHHCALSPPTDPRSSAVGTAFEQAQEVVLEPEVSLEDKLHEVQVELLAQLKRIEWTAAGLSLPLWLIAGLLFVLIAQQAFFGN